MADQDSNDIWMTTETTGWGTPPMWLFVAGVLAIPVLIVGLGEAFAWLFG